MPWSPSISSARQAATFPAQLHEGHGYRQTMYHDGIGLHITDSRRRSSMVRKVEYQRHAYADFVLYPTNDAPPSPRGRLVDVLQDHPAPQVSSAKPSVGSHVTSAKPSSKVRLKPAIIHGVAQSDEAMPDKKEQAFQSSAGPTPPQTPRLARLSTPDLSDLDEALFCECGVQANVVRCCTSCNKEVDLW
ncbi:hypothetical protein EJ02DRAFT_225415 [Clathrospora elynae]|uniref:Uncharacterized protein n=1 Tax=Clathrospora elynae TaxID=706981 RepID=A0A6A5SKI4_9PLEO|nr:hypothetical protein EJ02DRAFT_225415 [Clathrospora elynae]